MNAEPDDLNSARRTERLSEATAPSVVPSGGGRTELATGGSAQQSERGGEESEAPPIPWWLRLPRFRVLFPICVIFGILYRRTVLPFLDERGVSTEQFFIWVFVIVGAIALVGLPFEYQAIKKVMREQGVSSRRELNQLRRAERDSRRR